MVIVTQPHEQTHQQNIQCCQNIECFQFRWGIAWLSSINCNCPSRPIPNDLAVGVQQTYSKHQGTIMITKDIRAEATNIRALFHGKIFLYMNISSSIMKYRMGWPLCQCLGIYLWMNVRTPLDRNATKPVNTVAIPPPPFVSWRDLLKISNQPTNKQGPIKNKWAGLLILPCVMYAKYKNILKQLLMLHEQLPEAAQLSSSTVVIMGARNW